MDALCDVNMNSVEVIRFEITEYKGKSYADIRVFYRDTVTDELKPSKKGLCISLEIWPEFVKSLEVLGEAMKMRGLLGESEEAM